MPSKDIRDIDRRKFIKAGGTAGIVGLAGCTSSGSNSSGGGDGWKPTRNVRVIIPWGAGGGTDTMVRAVMNPAEKILSDRGTNVSFTYQNITGANGLNGARRALSQPADGHTLFASTNAIAPHIATGQANFSLDDWGFVNRVQHDTSWLYTSGRNNAEHGSIDSIVEKAKSGKTVNIGAVGGITGAAFSVLWANAAGILNNTSITTYQKSGRMRTDVISDEIDAGFGEIQELQEQYKAGDINLVLVGVEDRIDKFPDVPTTVEKGWDVTYGISRGFNVRSGTPDAAKKFWADLVHEAMKSKSYKQLEQQTLLYLRDGFQGPDAWQKTMKGNVDTYKQVTNMYNP